MNKKTILCCEDNKEVSMMVQVVLEDEDFHVVTVENGQEALDYLRAYPQTGLIILDLRMPRKTGLEFLKERKADPALMKVPVILLSGDITIGDVAKQYDIEHYIEKGCGPTKLLNTIHKIMDEKPPVN